MDQVTNLESLPQAAFADLPVFATQLAIWLASKPVQKAFLSILKATQHVGLMRFITSCLSGLFANYFQPNEVLQLENFGLASKVIQGTLGTQHNPLPDAKARQAILDFMYDLNLEILRILDSRPESYPKISTTYGCMADLVYPFDKKRALRHYVEAAAFATSFFLVDLESWKNMDRILNSCLQIQDFSSCAILAQLSRDYKVYLF